MNFSSLNRFKDDEAHSLRRMFILRGHQTQRDRSSRKRFVNPSSLTLDAKYAGLRSMNTPGVIPTTHWWSPRNITSRSTGDSSDHNSGRVVFSADYRPSIRVIIRQDKTVSVVARKGRKLRKDLPDAPARKTCMRGSIVISEPAWSPSPCKHSTYSEKRSAIETPERRVRKDHPEISLRMRLGSNMDEIMKSQFSNRMAC